MYAEDAFEASDLKEHDTLVTKEGEAVTVKHLHLSLSSLKCWPALDLVGRWHCSPLLDTAHNVHFVHM